MSEDFLKRLKAAEATLQKRNQTELAELIKTCAQDIQSLHQELQTQTQALLQQTAPALSESAKNTIESCEQKLDVMTAEYGNSLNALTRSKLEQMDQEVEAKLKQTEIGERLVQTMKSELPTDLTTPARQILMEEIGPIWTQRWAIALMAMMFGCLMILALMFYSAHRTKTKILSRAEMLSTIESEIEQQQRTLQAMHSQTMGVEFYRTINGMALKIPDNVSMRRPAARVRQTLPFKKRSNIYYMTEK